MAHNLKAGIMATTTMVGSALAYTRSQSEGGEARQGLAASGSPGHPPTHGGLQTGGGQPRGTEANKYQDTVHQMMHWKY